MEGQSLEEKGTELPTARTRGHVGGVTNHTANVALWEDQLGVNCRIAAIKSEKNPAFGAGNGWLPDVNIRCCFHENPLPSLPPPKKKLPKDRRNGGSRHSCGRGVSVFFLGIYSSLRQVHRIQESNHC